MGDEQTPTG
ncbi:Protein of unknown function [Bacillus cereus]|nr:Protein of unknown function [Bacillus cereus]